MGAGQGGKEKAWEQGRVTVWLARGTETGGHGVVCVRGGRVGAREEAAPRKRRWYSTVSGKSRPVAHLIEHQAWLHPLLPRLLQHTMRLEMHGQEKRKEFRSCAE